MADEEEKNQLIAQFSGVTDANAERAQFYLESSAWQLNVALSSFYDSMGDDGTSQFPSSTGQDEHTGRPIRHETPQGRFGTIGGLHADMQGSDDSDSDAERQAFYAGGSDRSGQQILGPPRKKKNAEDITQDVFEGAKRHGAEVIPDEESELAAVPKPRAFKGAGYRLGETAGETSQALPPAQREPEGPPKPREAVLKFWSNGFTVDDGPLRLFDDPNNSEFLKAVQKGEIPQELLRQSRGGEVQVSLEDHRNEGYEPPKQLKIVAFAGQGQKLGSPVPEVKFDHTPSSANSTSAGASSTLPPTADDTKPTTSIQIRLADGTRMVAKFNHTHTVGDIRRFICAARPQMGRNFVLQTTFPNKELSNEGQTLADGNLFNAVVVQRFK